MAQCDPYSADWGFCPGDTHSVNFNSISGGSGHYSYKWTPGFAVDLIDGQGTETIRVVAHSGNPTLINGLRYDSVFQCFTNNTFAITVGSTSGIIAEDSLPDCLSNSILDTLSFSYLDAGLGFVNWSVVGGSIVAITHSGSFTITDSLIVQWNPGVAHQIVGMKQEPIQSFGPSYQCDFSQSFYPPGANVRILGKDYGCLPSSIESYSVEEAPGYLITWSITNGSILSGQGTDSVTVEWTGNGTLSVTKTSLTCGISYASTLDFSMHEMQFSLGPDTSLATGDSIFLNIPGNAVTYAWSNGANWSQILAAAPDTISLWARDSYGCMGTDTIEISLRILSNMEEIPASSIFISENPSDRGFSLSLELPQPFQAELVDLTGHVLSRQEANPGKQLRFETANLPEGLYLMRLKTGNRTAFRRILVLH